MTRRGEREWMPSTISRMKRRRFSKDPPQPSVRWLVSGERNHCTRSSWQPLISMESAPQSIAISADSTYSLTCQAISSGLSTCVARWSL